MRQTKAIKSGPEADQTGAGGGRVEHYQTLLEINNALITILNERELLHAISRVLRRVIRCDKAALGLYEPHSDDIRILALDGSYSAEHIEVGQLMDRAGLRSGHEWDFRQPLLRADLETERQYSFEHVIYDEGLRSHITLPLVVHGEAVGIIGVGSVQPFQYTDADLVFMQEVAGQLALAVANMKAYEKIRELSAQTEATAERRRTLLEINNAIITNLTQEDLFEAVFAALPRVVPFDRAGISLYDARSDAYRIVALAGRAPSDHFTVGSVINRQADWVTEEFNLARPLLRADLGTIERNPFEQQLFREGVRSYCAVPLLVQGEVIGALSVTSGIRDRYSGIDVGFLQEIANQVAIAISNMTAYEEITALKAQLQAENIYLQEEIRQEHNFEEIIGNSPALLELLQQVERVAATDATALIAGETGTGKELIARAVHDLSGRKDRPLVKVNCGAISAGLVESELFGHVKGAFTGAVDKRLGRFELADGGTLFLDEVGELPLETQVKLLRVLQEGEFDPVGSSRTVRVDVRVIAATNRDLDREVREGRFRADLFYRLNVISLRVPPLRERTADIPQLVTFFLARFARRCARQIRSVSQDAMDALLSYLWPGNVRELQNVIERAVVLAPGTAHTLDRSFLPTFTTGASPLASEAGHIPAAPYSSPARQIPPAPMSSGPQTLEEVERQHIHTVLAETGWVIEGSRGAARRLGINPNTLRSRMKKLGLRRPSQEGA